MIILQIEHPVPDFSNWKKTFDSDPLNRKQAGVKRYKIFREADHANNVIVELEFDNVDLAKNLLTKLQQLWKQVEGKIITGPKGRIIEMVESQEL